MGRHAADVMVQLTARVPRGQQGFWEIIRDLHRTKKRWSFQDLDGRSNVDKGTVHDFLNRLLKAGYVVEDEVSGKTTFYRLVKNQPDAPRLTRDGARAKEPGLGQDHMWRVMKMLPRFNARELAAHAATAEVPVTLETAKSYVKHLHHAGYLSVVAPMTGRGATRTLAVYRLLPNMNTGPLAPQVQTTDFVWDPNRRTVMGPEAGKPAKVGGK